MVTNGKRLNDVFNLNNDTMTTEQNEIKSADWRKKNLSKNSVLADVMHRFPSNLDIWRWWKTQKFQKEQGEQEYMMIYEIDLPKILKAFSEHLLNGA